MDFLKTLTIYVIDSTIMICFTGGENDMVAIVEEKVKLLTIDGIDSRCSDACGDEDNCCEYGLDKMPIFNTMTVRELIK